MPEPAAANVHAFRVPAEDDREILVLVNYHESGEDQAVTLTTSAGKAKLAMKPLYPAILVSAPGKGVQAIESSGDAIIDGRLLIVSDLHFMAASMDGQPLPATSLIALETI